MRHARQADHGRGDACAGWLAAAAAAQPSPALPSPHDDDGEAECHGEERRAEALAQRNSGGDARAQAAVAAGHAATVHKSAQVPHAPLPALREDLEKLLFFGGGERGGQGA